MSDTSTDVDYRSAVRDVANSGDFFTTMDSDGDANEYRDGRSEYVNLYSFVKAVLGKLGRDEQKLPANLQIRALELLRDDLPQGDPAREEVLQQLRSLYAAAAQR